MPTQALHCWGRWVWPAPAFITWACAWAVFMIANSSLGIDAAWAMLLAAMLGVVLSVGCNSRSRRLWVVCGFPLSLLASGWAASVPAWAWLLPVLALWAVYPMSAWRDAPVFPTPRGALQGLSGCAPLSGAAPRVLDAGCGLGDGLRELHAAYPHARLEGLEWSRLLRCMCAWRCQWLQVPARVQRADIWAADWTVFDMVYLFQRPESMPRAAAKAAQQLREGAWLVSLEFEVHEWVPTARLNAGDGRSVWLYRAPFNSSEPSC